MNPLDTLGIFLGFMLFNITAGTKTGDENKFDKYMSEKTGIYINTSLKFILPNGIKIHIHHWLIMAILFVICSVNEINFIDSIFLGGCLQGLFCYDDSMDIITYCQ